MVLTWLRNWIDLKPKARSRRPIRPFRLRAERLEDRVTPSATLLKDINAHTGDAFSAYGNANAVDLNDRLYFFADDGTHGAELMSSDGTAAGTTLVKDINPGPTGSAQLYADPSIVVANGELFFSADDGVHGAELWVSDGTAAGTHMVKDINPNTYPSAPPSTDGMSSNISSLTAFNGKVLFSADDGTHGQELWISDGTAAGTHLVQDINPTVIPGQPQITQGSYPENVTVAGNNAYFAADDGQHGNELWVTNGTSAGTHLVKDIAPESGLQFNGSVSSNPSNLVATANGLIFFTTADGNIWKSDGMAAGTVTVAETGPNFVSNLFAVGNEVYFHTYDSVQGNALLMTDGSASGPTLLAVVAGPSATNMPENFTFANVAGTPEFVVAPSPGATGTQTTPQLWKTNGSPAGTVKVTDLPALPANVFMPGSVASYGNQLYFDIGQTLWTSNGLTGNTHAVETFGGATYATGPMTIAQFRNQVFLAADDGIHGDELWETNGTAAGTSMVADINPKTLDSNPQNFTTIGNVTYFSASDGSNGYALWKTDGTPNGTAMIKDVAPNPNPAGSPITYPYFNGASIGNFTTFQGKLYFTASDANGAGTHLWRSDGTAAGTIELTGGEEGGGPVSVQSPTIVGNTLYYTITNNSGTTGLWKINGSNGGAALVTEQHTDQLFLYPLAGETVEDIAPFPVGSPVIQDLTAVNGTLFFVGYDTAHGSELWATDGTAAETHMVMDINPTVLPPSFPGDTATATGSNIRDIVSLNGRAYFIANDGTHGSELWTSDGTAAGTHIVKDVNPGPTGSLDYSSNPGGSQPNLWSLGGKLYFNADDGVHGQELWISDGTAVGTQLLKDIHPNNLPPPMASEAPVIGSDIQNLTEVNGEIEFSADDGVHGQELWKTDGTTAGTMLLKDIWAGTAPNYYGGPPIPNGSNPYDLTNVNGTLFFTATDAAHGEELWMSDGTANGTTMVTDLNPGPASVFDPWNAGAIAPAPAGGVLVAADDGTHGRELWDINLSPPQTTGTPTTVNAGGSYTVTEGNSLQLHASVSGVANSSNLTFTWDLDGDGKFNDAKGANPLVAGSQLRAMNLTGGPTAHTISVEVTDRTGHEIGVGTAVLTIKDAPLVVSGFTYDVTEGQKFNRNVATFQDIGGTEDLSHYSAIINWGDGTSSVGNVIRDGSQLRVAGAHAYANHGDFNVQVAISEDGGNPTIATTTVHVHDAGISANRTYLSQTVGRSFTQPVASFKDRNPLGNISTFSTTINWGDGTTSVGTLVANASGGYNVMGTHTYATANDFTIKVNIVDAGVTTTVTSNAHVIVGQITARGLTAVGTATLDSTYAIAAFTDSDRSATANLFSASIAWADGTTSTGTIERDGNGGFRVIGDHRYGSTGLRSVKVTITDGTGRSATTIGTARVMGMM